MKSLVLFLFILPLSAWSQTGSIKGEIIDSESMEPLPFVNIQIMKGDKVVVGSATDFDGHYRVDGLEEGKYTVKVSYINFVPQMLTGVRVTADNITFANIKLLPGETQVIKEFEVIKYKVPSLDKRNRVAGGTSSDVIILDKKAKRKRAKRLKRKRIHKAY